MFFVLFVVGVLCFGVITIFNNVGYVLGIEFLSKCKGYLSLCSMIDDVTICALLMLGLCFCYVYRYTDHYFSGSRVEALKLKKLICLFVGVMGILICTGDVLSTLII